MIRRSFLFRLPALPALLPTQQQPARRKASDAPARHRQDAWLDEASGKHRVIFDTWMSDRFGDALRFADNWLRVNREDYGLADHDLSVVIVARHGTLPFALNESVWTKYGRIFAERMWAADPAAHPNPTTNIHASQLSELTSHGVRLALCNLATRRFAQNIAEQTGGEQQAVYAELTTNTIGNGRIVPAGVVTVTRAQEHGYALISVD